MLKKFGMVTVGVTAGLLAVAPMASASDHDHDRHSSSGSQSCESNGGDAEARGEVSGDAIGGNLLTQAPVGGASIGAIASCNENVLNDNVSNNQISVADGLLGGDDELPVDDGTGDGGE